MDVTLRPKLQFTDLLQLETVSPHDDKVYLQVVVVIRISKLLIHWKLQSSFIYMQLVNAFPAGCILKTLPKRPNVKMFQKWLQTNIIATLSIIGKL